MVGKAGNYSICISFCILAKIKTMKVYLVQKGYYSDRNVVGIFSTEEKAKYYCENIDTDETDWEEIDIDKEIKPEYWFNVSIGLFTGRLFDCHHTCYDKEKNVEEYDLDQYNTYKEVYLRVTTPARDRDHAIKIAADKRREWIATKNIRDAVI